MSKAALPLTLLVLVCRPAPAQAMPGGIDPEAIDPYRLGAAEFLDTDLYALLDEARTSYGDGDYESAARYYLAYLEHNIADAGNIYNLSCCYALLGRERLAALNLLRAFRAGFDDLDWAMEDPDFDSVRDGALLSTLIDSLRLARSVSSDAPGEVLFAHAGVVLPCRVTLPDGYREGTPVPLVVGLHGYGSNPDMCSRLYERFETRDFILAVPRAPYTIYTGTVPGYSWATGDGNDPGVWEASARATVGYVLSLVDLLRETYDIGEVYLLGFSQGCGFAYATGLSAPERFDGLICFAGHLDSALATAENLEAAASLRIFIGHGYDDRSIPCEASEEAFETLDDAGMDVELFLFDAGHSIPVEAVREAERWMRRG